MNSLQSRYDSIKTEIEYLQSVVDQAPEGLVFTRTDQHNKTRFYKSSRNKDGKIEHTYLNKKMMNEARALGLKAYAKARLKDLETEEKYLGKLINFYNKPTNESKLLESNPSIVELLPENTCSQGFVRDWKNASYNRNTKYPQNLIYTTPIPGLMVRSKSEAIIASRLAFYNVPFRYEEVHVYNGIEVAEDFTCLNIYTQETWIWDHKGRMDDSNYVKSAKYRDELRAGAGLIPWINLIETFETLNRPLDIEWVDMIIKKFLI